MNTEERDKFLTEAIGECYHDFSFYEEYERNRIVARVCRCGAIQQKKITYNSFSTWEGFGKLWDWSKKQDWWFYFINLIPPSSDHNYFITKIHPDKFANAVYEYLKDKK